VRDVIPAPDSDHPTAGHGCQNVFPRFRNQPKNERIVKPALRHDAAQQQKKSIAVTPAPKREGQQRPRNHQQRYEVLVAVQLSNPVDGPMRTEEKTGEQQSATCECAKAREMSGGNG